MSDETAEFTPPDGLPSIAQIAERQQAAMEKIKLRPDIAEGLQVDVPRLAQLAQAMGRILVAKGVTTPAEIEYYVRLEAIELVEQLILAAASRRVSAILDTRAGRRRDAREAIRKLAGIDAGADN